ncbi:AEC family transporter [Psychrosphaera ytuae]|uniref:AEC family transporter n=1 Tax=Psychrosphaera ytuae TaxID=2820710 RepID=A0A975D9W1_9GAMM|nr:AEC family transporter [Psychrosphaera ytuae]QTH62989.1 AEC family transporter [Psychrosphaera ytuae]
MDFIALYKIIPLALICLLGFVCVFLSMFTKDQINAVSKLSFNVLIPLFLFQSTRQADLDAALSWQWFFTFYASIVGLFILTFSYLRWVKKQQRGPAAMRTLTATYSNTVLVAIPVLVGLLGTQTAGQAFVLLAFHSAILFTLVELLATKVSSKTIFSSFKNPIVMSIAAGLLFNLSGLTLPELVSTPMTQLGQAAIPLALFCLGASMRFLPIKGNRVDAMILSTIKLFVLPMITFLVGTWVGLDATAMLIVVLLTASPTGVNAFIMASKHQVEEGVSATTVVLSTMLSVISISFWSHFLFSAVPT